MNLRNYPRRVYAIDQFTQPDCLELEGEKFHFVLDNGYDYYLNFIADQMVEWNYEGEEPKKATYQCRKGDDTTYMVDFELAEFEGKHERENHLFIIDLEQRLVTMAICKVGENPKFPYLVSSKYIFGAIEEEGKNLPYKRHCFTSDLSGTRIQWHWNTAMQTQHCYYTSGYYRLTKPSATYGVDPRGNHVHQKLPSNDDIAQYIKIKDNMYLFSLVEELMERMLQDHNPPFRSNDMKFLQNYDRMYHVGRTFGNVKRGGDDEGDPGTVVPCHIGFGAFGRPVDLDPVFLNTPNPHAP
ncbi:MAG: MoaF N-terminal domain-containing protein [Oscillospiraceae bacterium]|nr:MoaF N-terminal domain-containing protein [Oscillospiraceae bacterium]